ncbi:MULTISPECIES: cell division protein SepF [Fusobacterium]|uniref:cell division protein SepF n=1 Tax=Fusobacterium TaxID=848 RepID=UPI001476E5BB|nr:MULTISPECIES: cell division protein SepF [Fusobacterium]NME36186.1 cell division protein SepF [Fusobacterium sp. FSA-380-WT-3A]
MDCEIAFFKPERFEECLKYVGYLKENKYVHINLADVEENTKKRIMDFLSGAMFIQEGKIIYLGENIICTVPKNGKYFLEYENKLSKKDYPGSYDEEEEIIPIFRK